jgi:hypothetical protein
MSRATTLAALALVATVLVGGCTKARTEAVVVVTTDGVRVPDDIDALDLVVADTADLTNPVFQKSFRICGGDVASDCFSLPLNFTLIPGAHHDHSSRVQITATRHAAPEIDDAAIFTFAEGVSLRLDFVLYANCLGNVECAKRDQACGPLDTCIDLKPGNANGGLDIALPRGPEDMSMPLPPDMTMVDLKGADLTMTPADLVSTLDLAGCASVTCDMGEQCVAGMCQPCGFLGDPCCFGPIAPPPHPNAGGGTGSGMCIPTNTVCAGGMCVNCGGDGEPCCTMQLPECNGIDVCTMGTCQPPPDMSMPNDMSLTVSDMGLGMSSDLF